MRVLVTRPLPAAARTAEKLRALGHQPLLLPLTRTDSVSLDESLFGADFDAVAVTSANALRHAPAALVARLAGLPCQAVGERTAAAARQAGFRLVITGSGVADGLSARLVESAPRHVAYLCGRVRRPEFEASLGAAGIAVTAIETYDTVAAELPDDRLAAAFQSPIDAVLLYSRTAATALAALARTTGPAAALQHALLLCLSGRIAAALDPAAAKLVRVAREPVEQALLSMLASRS